MLPLLFMSTVFGHPVKPDGWEKRTDAQPYLVAPKEGTPERARNVDESRLRPGWDIHVRTAPKQGQDDWHARLPGTAVPMSFRTHQREWPSDDWAYYQMLGRIRVDAGTYKFGVGFMTGDAGIGCFADLRIGGVSAVQVDIPKFFSQRQPKTHDADELNFFGNVKLASGTYDAVITLGCHPDKIGKPIEGDRFRAWRDTKFMVLIQKPGESLRPMRSAEVSHLR